MGWKESYAMAQSTRASSRPAPRVSPPDKSELKSAGSYAVAEILRFKIDSGDPDYLEWITVTTQ